MSYDTSYELREALMSFGTVVRVEDEDFIIVTSESVPEVDFYDKGQNRLYVSDTEWEPFFEHDEGAVFSPYSGLTENISDEILINDGLYGATHVYDGEGDDTTDGVIGWTILKKKA